MRPLLGLTLFVAFIASGSCTPLHQQDIGSADLGNVPAQPDADELQLEKLKSEGSLPKLEKQLKDEVEHELQSKAEEPSKELLPEEVATTEDANSEIPKTPLHHISGHGSNEEPKTTPKDETPVKAFPGAARLTSGKHETLPTSETPAPPLALPRSEFTPNGHRRSLNTGHKNDVYNHQWYNSGQYSPLDMAQYVFWTGDEAGVAKAIQEFIQNRLMSREEAINFLRDIRIGIEYLQSRYETKSGILRDMIPREQETSNADATNKESVALQHLRQSQAALTPMYNSLQNKLNEGQDLEEKTENSLNIMRTGAKKSKNDRMNRLDYLEKSANNIKESNLADYEEIAGRLRLADFLYTEYSLEEVIYQLAKVMFTESLTHGSGHAGEALERLTGFLDSEGAHGRIPKTLQKKVLDVLLAALSDTLVEHPELINAARDELGHDLSQIQTKHLGQKN